MNDSITADLFAALNVLVLERINLGSFKITGTIPSWVSRFCRQTLTSGTEVLIPLEKFTFLANFMIDAEEFWQQKKDIKLKSGLWIDKDLAGEEYNFEAVAIWVNSRKFLLIELTEDSYHEKQEIIQKAREYQLNYQYLLKHNQKKEVLIHCIIHDIASLVSSMNCCLSLLDSEDLTLKGKENLQIGKQQCLKQEMMLREILDAFSAEVQSLDGFTNNPETAPDILISALQVTKLLKPNFLLHNVQLYLMIKNDLEADWKVIGDQLRLDRIISNLAENALRHSQPDSTVRIALQQDGEYVLVTVDDEGTGVELQMTETLFEKYSQGKVKSGVSGIGLYFCRITVERWGGAIGYLPRPEGGSRFWFRLPKARF
ncbi:MAG: HAMP domain-containing sensor histidine kinase [Gloeotrichia echinulata CP02]|jgi:signal transduction histidine kinase